MKMKIPFVVLVPIVFIIVFALFSSAVWLCWVGLPKFLIFVGFSEGLANAIRVLLPFVILAAGVGILIDKTPRRTDIKILKKKP